MYTKKYIENELLAHFEGQEAFTREELFNFLRTMDPDLRESTFAWRIFDLKKKHRIRDVGKGVYSVELKQPFKPEIDQVISKIGAFLTKSINHHSSNIWTTAWLNELVELQATSFLYILEVDRTSMEDVFFSLKDTGEFPNVYLNPDGKMIEHYISELPQAIVITPMVSRAPTMKVRDIILPTLEKILVDLFCDPELYFAYQGQQLVKIFEVALSKYVINYSRLFNYAKRRHREDTLKAFLHKQPGLYDEILSIIE